MLGHKVSRERVGNELDGMLTGPDPVAAVRLLQRMGLFEAVFAVHPSAGGDVTEAFAAAGAALLGAAHRVLGAWAPAPALGADERRQALLAALLLPLRGVELRAAKGRAQR
jgi:tRNA nucleotidyltransferase/poly(A) polymerase